jgi:hypothetical protein
MKNRILFTTVLTVLLFPSCKKDRQCKCVISYNYGKEITQDVLYKKVTKREVKALCTDYESTYNNSMPSIMDCKLE